MKLLLIDGSNLAYRTLFTAKGLSYHDQPVGMLYGFLRSFLALKRRYPLHRCVIVWDYHSKRRQEESQAAVEKGIVPKVYKATRRADADEATKVLLLEFKAQIGPLRDGLKHTSATQISVEDYEADDVIASIVCNGEYEQAMIVTSDHDYYALLRENVIIEDGIRDVQHTLETFKAKYGIEPTQWVELGALMGDAGDCIYGVPGVGEVRALAYIKKYHTAMEAVAAIAEQATLSATDRKVLEHVDRVVLAHSLKKMDSHLQVVIPEPQYDTRKLWLFFDAWGFESLKGATKEF